MLCQIGRPCAGDPSIQRAIAQRERPIQIAVEPTLAEHLTQQGQRRAAHLRIAGVGQLDRPLGAHERFVGLLGPHRHSSEREERVEQLAPLEVRDQSPERGRARLVLRLNQRDRAREFV